MAKKNKGKISDKQLKAIRRNYAVQNAIKNGAMPVTIRRLPDKNNMHYHVIVDNVDDNHVSVGLTTDPYKGKNHPNYRLEMNPLFNERISYMRREGTVKPKLDYNGIYQGAMSEKDYNKAKDYGEKAKKKYLDKKNKKK